jgi:hypothetical protein
MEEDQPKPIHVPVDQDDWLKQLRGQESDKESSDTKDNEPKHPIQ